MTVVTALLFGTVPAFRATRLRLTDSSKDCPVIQQHQREEPTREGSGSRSGLLSLVLMVGAELFLRTLATSTALIPV